MIKFIKMHEEQGWYHYEVECEGEERILKHVSVKKYELFKNMIAYDPRIQNGLLKCDRINYN